MKIKEPDTKIRKWQHILKKGYIVHHVTFSSHFQILVFNVKTGKRGLLGIVRFFN
jgi:hypothetical protein